MSEFKVCRICKLEKDISEYHVRKEVRPNKTYYFPRTECKVCLSALVKATHEANPERKQEYSKQYYNKNREDLKAKNRQYYADNSEKLREYAVNYQNENKETIREQRAAYYQDNKEVIDAKKEKWRQENRGKDREMKAKYARENSIILRAARRKWENEKLKTDINYKLQKTLRGRIRLALKGICASPGTVELVGCSIADFIQHIEKQFKEGMSWENHGLGKNKWQIDHKTPLSWFDLSDDEQMRKAFHYTNQQPLWAVDNRAKSNLYADV